MTPAIAVQGESPRVESSPLHHYFNERFAGLHFPLVILTHPSISGQPSKRSFNDPSAGLAAPAAHPWRALDHFELPAASHLAPLGQFVSLVCMVSPDFLEACHRGTKEARPASRQHAPTVSCTLAGVT